MKRNSISASLFLPKTKDIDNKLNRKQINHINSDTFGSSVYRKRSAFLCKVSYIIVICLRYLYYQFQIFRKFACADVEEDDAIQKKNKKRKKH